MESSSSFGSFKVFLCFLVAGILIVMSLPRGGQFKYEYYKGKPWMHERLDAPFDFPIYKNSEELAADKESVEQSYSPYFRENTTTAQKELRLLSDELDKHADKLNAKLRRLLPNELDYVYKQGVWQLTELRPEFASRPMLVVSVVSNNVSEDHLSTELFTPETAYIFLSKKVQDSCGVAQLNELSTLIDLKRYIAPNLSYDESTTRKVKEGKLADIPTTKGVVRAGVTIVDKGEVVGDEQFHLLESLRKEYESKVGYSGSIWMLLAGQLLLVALCMACLYIFLGLFRPDILKRPSSLIFILMLIVLFVYLSLFVIRNGFSIYLVPLAVIPIYISNFFGARPAMFVYWVVLLLLAYHVPNSFEFVFLSFTVGISSIVSFRTMYRRGKLFVSIGLVLAAYVLSYMALQLIQEGTFSGISWKFMLIFVINVLLILTSYQLVYVFEKLFGFMSNVTLMELSDTNRKLLRMLSEKAPGTFQHSMQVANLAEEVIREIGGNPLLVRCGALYHDIGKMENPAYFIENQAKGFNPHERLEPEESADIIIKHVEDGIQLAKKYNLPAAIINFIRTHHATAKTYYFYNKYREKHPEATDFSRFTYQGPSPSTREAAVVMMADGIEAASRTLTPITTETIDALVERLVNFQAESGYFNNVNITFKDLSKAKQVFKKKLSNIYHARIEYPEMKD